MLVHISCKGNKIEHHKTLEKVSNSEIAKKQEVKAYCFFELDDKYSEDKDSLVIKNWLKEESRLILKNDTIGNVFGQNGGGPNGAQWNPSTDLYVAILKPSNELHELPKLYLNGKSFTNQFYKYSPVLSWYLVKQDFWEQELREIDATDIKKMFSSEILRGIETGEYFPMTPLNYGEILKFEIRYKEEALTKFFHATYGE